MNDHSEEELDFEPEDELGEQGAAQAKLKKLREQLKEAQAKRDEYLAGWQREKADSINARKDALADADRRVMRAKISFVEEILPALDAFEQALKHLPQTDATWIRGFQGVGKEIWSSLNRLGIERIDDGGTYDPQKHYVIAERETKNKAMHGGMDLQRSGYMFDGHVIRPAEVILLHHKE